MRALYRFAYQAPFAYAHRRDALEAAAAKRVIASKLIKHKLGRDMVAGVVGIDDSEGRLRFVTEYVPGPRPGSNREVERDLSELFAFFKETGLPTWQISPANPHAYSNFIRTPRGELKLIDLESSLVSFSVPFTQLLAYVRDGNFPAFDDVDFVRLRKYVAANASDLRESLGRENLEELNQAIEIADDCSHQWRHSEPRIWGKIGQRVYRIFDLSGVIAWSQRRLIGAEIKAQDFLNAAVDRWEHEGRIDDMEAARLRDSLATSEVTNLTRHLGAHLVISVALRFPIGSLARFGWTLGFRVKARKDLSKGTITAEQYAAAKSIHSIPVMLISLIPGLGTIAYFASSTVRKTGFSRLLIDQFIYKLPFRLYYRLRLSCAIAPCPLSAKISNDFTPHLHK
ncbi:MAG: hypothetical protein IIB15_04650 [Chloroflexi bacterium]|nr:hypothetical protein [Chloroflexota bacterium]